jgi:hypothetical protein
MPLFLSTDRPDACITVCASATDYARELPFRNFFETDVMLSRVNEIQVGNIVYPLRQSCAANFIPGVGDFLVEGFSPTFVGHGPTVLEAREDWALAVHAAFQELQYKRPFEMTEDEKNRWSVLSSRIDVTVFRNCTPLSVREFGRVDRKRGRFPEVILWENGKKESIDVSQVDSPDFVTYKVGQPLEAVVARDPITFKLLRIVDVKRRSSPSRLDTNDEANLLNDIGSTKSLPTVGW